MALPVTTSLGKAGAGFSFPGPRKSKIQKVNHFLMDTMEKHKKMKAIYCDIFLDYWEAS
jgi:hypothetical protein